MKPDEWQIQEALDRLLRTVEFRYVSELPLADVLRNIGLMQLKNLTDFLEKADEEEPK